MTLNIDEQEKIYAAELEEMSFAIIDAIRSQQLNQFDTVMAKLQDFASDITIPQELRYAARNIIDNAALDLTEAGIAQMTATIDGLSQAGSGLRSAIRVLDTGKQEFFFPSVAAASQRALAVIKAFKEAADKLEGAGENIGDIGPALSQAKDAIENLKDQIDAARG